MKILIVGLNYAPELTGIGKYSGEMAEWFASRGHQVRVVTAPPYYPEWKVAKPYHSWKYRKETINGVSVIRCPIYVPRQPSTVTRLIHLVSFSMSIAPVLFLQLFWRPKVVINPVPSLLSSPLVLILAWLVKARSVLHIQDFEVDAMFGLGMGGGRLSGIAKWFERFILGRFDLVSTISAAMQRNAESKTKLKRRSVFFPNWSDIEKFNGCHPSEGIRARFNIQNDEKFVLYSGNLGEKQGLELVLDAAAKLSDRPIKFIMVGQGAGKERLEQLAVARQLKNISFHPLQPLEDLPAMLATADCHLVVQRRGAADAVLPSKLTNILAAGGNAVITAEPDTELGLLCTANPQIAELVEPENCDEFVAGISKILDKYEWPNTVASNYANQYLAKGEILTAFESQLTRMADA